MLQKSDDPARETKRTTCTSCPLRAFGHFREFSKDEEEFVSSFKKGELSVNPGAAILVEGSHSAHLFTVLTGWGFRYKLLEDGRRQILNYILPGDMIGLQGSLMGEMQHGVEALSSVNLCVFERDKLMTLFEKHPDLGYDLTWMASREERILDENLLSVGRRSALERAAYLIVFLFQRAKAVGMANKGRIPLPLTQQHVADTLGLSIVHTNKTLRKLAARGLIRWAERGCVVLDEKRLLDVAGWSGIAEECRPFI